MSLQEEYDVYGAYELPYQPASSTSVGVLEAPPARQTPVEQDAFAAVNRNSGGALINLQGQLVGIPTLTAVNSQSNTTANGVSFAIPSNLVETALQQILQQ